MSCRHNLAIDVLGGGELILEMSSKVSNAKRAMTPHSIGTSGTMKFERMSDAFVDEWYGGAATPRPSCALDVADDDTDRTPTGELTLHQVGEAMRVTRERVRQIEVLVLGKLREAAARLGEDK